MSDNKEKILVGLDIGYSNMKITYGKYNDLDSMTNVVLPSNFQEISQRDIDDFFSNYDNAKIVTIDDKKFLTCVNNPKHCPDFETVRSLDKNYPFSVQYKALYLSALLEIGVKEIERLVIGLPVDQYKDTETRDKLKHNLMGEFYPNKDTKIVVKNVDVVAQPLGSYFSESFKEGNEELCENSLLVIDIGCYSADWIVMEEQRLMHCFSGSTNDATNSILKKTQEKIISKYGKGPMVSMLEQCTKTGKETITFSGKIGKVEYLPFLNEAKEEISTIGVNIIKGSIAKGSSYINDILLVGGGAKYYANQVAIAFPDSVIHTSDDSVLSNSKGFFIYANLMEKRNK